MTCNDVETVELSILTSTIERSWLQRAAFLVAALRPAAACASSAHCDHRSLTPWQHISKQRACSNGAARDFQKSNNAVTCQSLLSVHDMETRIQLSQCGYQVGKRKTV
eukprot:2323146-Amphidinium_carterae.1